MNLLQTGMIFSTITVAVNYMGFSKKKPQKSWHKTSLGEIGLKIRTNASPRVGQEQLSRGGNVLTSVANVLET